MSRRRLALAAGATLLVTALTGCGKVNLETLVYDDATYDMTVYVVAEDTEIEASGSSPEIFSDLLVSTFEATPGTEGWTFTSYATDGASGVQATGLGIEGDDVGMFGTGLFTSDDETVTFDFEYPMTTVVPAAGITAEQAAASTVTMTVEFPGDVIDHNGTLVDDRTVEWTSPADEDPHFTATSATSTAVSEEATEDATEEASEPAEDDTDTSAAKDDSEDSDEDAGVNWLLWISIGVGVLALAGLVTWLVLRGRGPKSGGPGGPGAQQQWGQQPPQGGQPQQWGQQPQPGAPGAPQQWGQQPQPGGQPPQGGQGQPPQGGQPQQPWGQQPPPA